MRTILAPLLAGAAFIAVTAGAATHRVHDPANSTPDAVVRSMQDDDALLERVASELANDPELGDSDITVYVGEGRVALQGETRTAGQAVRAVALARRAAGSGVEVVSDLRSEHPRDAADA